MENKNTPGETPDLGSARRDLEQAYDDPDADFSIERVEEILKPNVSEEKLKAFLEEICSDQQIKSYEELTAHNFAQFQMERLKREVHQKSVEDRGDLAYRAMYEATPSRRIRAQLLRMNEYALRKAEFEKLYGLKADPELERATAQYMAALAKTLRARVVLGNLRILAVTANQKKQKLDPVVLEQAIASLPTRIDGRAQRVDENDRDLPRVFSFTEADKRALQKASPEQIIANATLVDATAQLNTDIGWLLEANADVPGVLPGADGVLPADVMLMDLLARAIEENVKQVNDHPKDKVYRNERIAHRQKIISQIHFLRRTMGENKIQTITDLNLHEIFNRTFDDKASEPTESEPFDYAKMREHMDGELHKSVRGFREHKIEMMGEDGKGGVLEETPKVALEHFFNHEYRQKVIFPVMDGIVTMRLSVRRLLGKLPIIWDGQEVGEGRKEILEELKEEMGFPDTVMVNGKTEEFDPYNSKHWDALSQEQLTVIAQKMISTKDVLDTMRPKIVEQLRKVDDDMLVLEDLRLRAHPDELIGVDVDEELLGNMQRGAFDVNSQNIDALIQGENGEVDRGKLAAVYLGIQFQMNRHWEAYSETMYQFDSGMVRVADRHNEMSTVYRDTLDKVPWPWLEAMLAGLVAWYGVSVLRSGDPRNPMNWLRGFRRMGQDIRYVYRKGKWVVEKGVEGGRYVYRKGPPAIRNLYRRGREAGEWVYRENKWVREKRTGWPQAMNSQEIRTLKQSMTPEMRYAFAKRLLERTGDLTQ
ncbi:MAG TPA: hypothetical protein VI873_02505, partial [Candidatus Peribacteraceae bacterium]|nr:hypothetical protein [Candidatus Peribacteraceae bacterium]